MNEATSYYATSKLKFQCFGYDNFVIKTQVARNPADVYKTVMLGGD